MRRRGRQGRGFSLVEATVALTIGAMALALMAGAGWGLRQLAPRDVPRAEARDWLVARRVLQDAGLAIADRTGYDGAGDRLRVRVPAPGGGAPEVLEVTLQEGEGAWRLDVARGAEGAAPRRATVLEGRGDARLSYLIQGPLGQQPIWRDAAPVGTPPPLAIAFEAANTGRIVAPVPVSVDAGCVARAGRGGLEGRECDLR